MSRTPDRTTALAMLIITASASWSTTLRLTAVCAALSLPAGTSLTLYLLLR
jgi:hypothetical protein